MSATRVYIVTPSFNSASTIERTLLSVAAQAGDFELFYHVQDGGSSDGTVEILQRFDDLITYGVLPKLCTNIRFSYDSQPDDGMYDAIVRGFTRLSPADSDWMGWINADDVFLGGAFAMLATLDRAAAPDRINWITGSAAQAVNGVMISNVDKPVSSDVASRGLCEGEHWDFIQSEGTFFRHSAWNSIDVERDFRAFRFAGDWNLWRALARHERLFQTPHPLGLFSIREGQLSQLHREDYEAEISALVSKEERQEGFAEILFGEFGRTVVRYDFPTRSYAVETQPLRGHAHHWRNKLRARGAKLEPKAGTEVSDAACIPVIGPARILAYDADWQYPAITEQHAYNMAKALLPAVDNVTYLAFPWATLIDLINNKKEAQHALLDKLKAIRPGYRQGQRVVTVCQHILLRDYLYWFREAGVTDIFWTHATRGENVLHHGRDIQVHPFPLYPVQVSSLLTTFDKTDRKHLYSFVGARANKWYLTEVRNWILDQLAEEPRGFVVGRDSWHYNRVVYQHQVQGARGDGAALIDKDASEQFRATLAESLFSLCPSGSGPNSIRLWESIGAGSIPVILADTWAPPGNHALWEQAVVFAKETPESVAALPDQLEALAKDKDLMAAKRHALRQLWLLYGPETFIHDIEKLYLKLSAEQAKAAPTSASKDSEQIRGDERVRVFPYGRHKHRTPVNYPPYKRLQGDRVELVSAPENADVLVVGFDIDLRENASEIQTMLRQNPRIRTAVVSEEPLWDTIWSAGFRERKLSLRLANAPVDIHVFNHVTSDVFQFRHIPYFVTTSDEYFVRYANMFRRNAQVEPKALLAHWEAAPVRAALYAERRDSDKYDLKLPDEDIYCLCHYRSAVGEAWGNRKDVVRIGMGWRAETARRQTLPDWHLDKLAALDKRARVVSGLENTHHRDYITEKIFDAYAVLGIPLYFASPAHRVSELVEPDSFLNAYGMDADAAGRLALEFKPDLAWAEAYHRTQKRLAALFGDPARLIDERRRVIAAVANALRDVKADENGRK